MKAKFKVTDEVVFLRLGRIQRGKIEAINLSTIIDSYDKKVTCFFYWIKLLNINGILPGEYEDVLDTFSEKDIFATEDELLDAIRK